jgi:hypothetical protein
MSIPGCFKAGKIIFLFFVTGVSACFLMLSLTEIALHQYLKSKAADYVKTTFEVDHFHYPMRKSGRTLAKHLMAHGTVDGEPVTVALKSVRIRIDNTPRAQRGEKLMNESKVVPIYKRRSDVTSTLFQGRSLKFVEADYFENGSPRAWPFFLTTLITCPLFFLWFKTEAREINATSLSEKMAKA